MRKEKKKWINTMNTMQTKKKNDLVFHLNEKNRKITFFVLKKF